MPFSAVDILVGLIYTWGVGLTPALVARRIRGGPLSRKRATIIALVSCFILALVALILKSAAGEPNPRVSPAWIFVFLVSRWLMIRGNEAGLATETANSAKSPEFGGGPSKLSRAQMITRLGEMVADPTTSDEHRRGALIRLEQLDRGARDHSSLRSRPTDGSAWGRVRPSRATLSLAARLLALLIVVDILLMVSGYRLLVREKIVLPNDTYVAGEWGDLGTYGRSTIACWYWTGRRLIPEASWYGQGKSERDECSILHKHEPGE